MVSTSTRRLREFVFEGDFLWIGLGYLVMAGAIAAWKDSSEDAYITYRHVWNLVERREPGFNAGEPVMGFTSPLHMMSLALLRALLPVEMPVIGPVFAVVVLAAFVFVLARLLARLGFRPIERALATFVLLCNGPFLEGSLAGLETPLVLALMASSLLLLTREPRPVAEGLLLALLGLTRPDTIWFVPGWFLARLSTTRSPRYFAGVLAAGLPLLAGWIGCATLLYGTPVPQSVLAKRAVYFAAQTLDASKLVANTKGFLSSTLSLGLGAPGLDHSLFNQGAVLSIALGLVSLVIAWKNLPEPTRRVAFVLAAYILFFAVYAILTSAMHAWYFLPTRAAVLVLSAIGWFGLPALRAHPRVRLGVPALTAVAFAVAGVVVVNHHHRLERTVVDEVKWPLVKYVEANAAPDDVLMLEPLGHVGWGLRGRKVIDFPGLVEPKVSAIVQRSGVWSYGELMKQLKPQYVSLRPPERDAILRETPDALSTYEHVAVFQANRSHPPYLRDCADCEYHLYRRSEGP
ncbi:hypothetical protein [Polyangium sp. 15x6]|uniref:hypothetical protein n=1 Tax=Polyangium sp. 15x6 TaxID=3042687 RepID=UPI00249BF8F7|nr:hypothetical protein [Polyangium sp. 15x6]MDI3286954.1 hypothetical protein [Polyangium sp. 15x6]